MKVFLMAVSIIFGSIFSKYVFADPFPRTPTVQQLYQLVAGGEILDVRSFDTGSGVTSVTVILSRKYGLVTCFQAQSNKTRCSSGE